MIRDDLSEKLIHLTRGEIYEEAAQTFENILSDQKLLGGTGCIKGGFQCVCFSEAPISKLGTILANPMALGMRYKPFGVMVDKHWLFARGGRPVIYQADGEYELLHRDHRWRHVRYEPGIVDFTWEREWRIHTDELPLDRDATTFVIPKREWESRFFDKHIAKLGNLAFFTRGMIGPKSVAQVPWHFIALEDLGVTIPED